MAAKPLIFQVGYFGPPARTFAAGSFMVLVWHQNLLRDRMVQLPPARPAIC